MLGGMRTALLALFLVACPATGDDDSAVEPSGWILNAYISNSTGFDFDQVGVAMNAAPQLVDLESPLPTGYFTLARLRPTWSDFPADSTFTLRVRTRDVDGDCYAPGGVTLSTNQAVEVEGVYALEADVEVTFDHYEGGGCP